jgi:hypothetical protein
MSSKNSPSLNLDRLRERESTMVSSGKYGRLKDGKTILRLFTFEHLVSQQDYDAGVYRDGSPFAPEIGSSVREIDLRLVTHYIDGKVIPCEGPGCPHCAESAKAKDPAAKKSLSARQQFQVNAIDMEMLDDGMKIWTLPTSVYKEILSVINSGEIDAESMFGSKGRDFIIKKDKNQPPSSMYKVMLRDASKCTPISANYEDSVTDLIVEKTNRFVKPATAASPVKPVVAAEKPKASTPAVPPATTKKTTKKKIGVGDEVTFVDGDGSTMFGSVSHINESETEFTVVDENNEEWVMGPDDFKAR